MLMDIKRQASEQKNKYNKKPIKLFETDGDKICSAFFYVKHTIINGKDTVLLEKALDYPVKCHDD